MTVGMGGLYTGIRVPTLSPTTHPVGNKQGKSSAVSILGLIAVGDASMAKAAKAGRITKISTVDTKYTSVLFGLYCKTTTEVSGE